MTVAAGALDEDSPDARHETHEWLTYVVRFDPRDQARPKRCQGQPAPMPLNRRVGGLRRARAAGLWASAGVWLGPNQ